MKIKTMCTLLSATLFISACATTSVQHSHIRGSVVTLDSPQEAHVCLGQTEIKSGDKLNVYESVCRSEMDLGGRKPIKKKICDKIPRGQAEVIESLGEHFAKVRSLDGLVFKEGFIVEKTIN